MRRCCRELRLYDGLRSPSRRSAARTSKPPRRHDQRGGRASRKIAERSGNEEYYISDAWLTQLENTNSVPSIYKLFSLSVIYRSTFADLLAIFGIDLASSARYQLDVPLANTHRVTFETPHPAAAVTFPIRLDRSFSLEKDQLGIAGRGGVGKRPCVFIPAAGPAPYPIWLYRYVRFHHVPAASTGDVRSN